MDIARAFKVFDLPENASLDDVRHAWHDLIFIWHPDKHQRNPSAQKRALEKTKEINEAYEFLCNYLSSRPRSAYEQPKQDVHEEYTLIVCWDCGVTNRIPKRHGYVLRCGRCGAVISYSDEQKKQGDDWNQRQLCGDGICTGIIAPDGRCTACGKTWEEGRRAEQYRQQSNAKAKQTRTSNKVAIFFNTHPKGALILTTFVTFLIITGFILFAENTPKTIKPAPPALAVAPTPVPARPPAPAPLFDKPVQPLPQNGAVFRLSSEDFIAPLRITTPSSDEHYFVKVVHYDSNTPIAAMFIRAGMTAEMKVPVGSFAIKYATGKIWYGRKYLFGPKPKTAFFRCDDKFDFYIHGDKVRGHRIELVKQRGGNLHTVDISEAEF